MRESREQENDGFLDFDFASLRYRQSVLRTGAEAPKTLPQFLPVRERYSHQILVNKAFLNQE